VYVQNNPLIYIDPTGHCVAGKDSGCFVDSFTGADDSNVFEMDIKENSDMWWIVENVKLPSCGSKKKCISGWESAQHNLEVQNDFYRNDPCHYLITGGCSSTKVGSFILDGNRKAIGVRVDLFEKKSWSFFGTASAAEELPDGKVGRNHLGRIEHYFKGDDHGPAHVHVYDNRGKVVKVGQNGKPLDGQPELNRDQKKLVAEFKKEIRATTTKIMKWYRYNNLRRSGRR
jgi:hypothetical protein